MADIQEVASGLKTRQEIHEREGRRFEEVQAQKEYEERLIWQSATRIANEFGLDPVVVRNSIASTGVVEEKQENKIDKDSANAN